LAKSEGPWNLEGSKRNQHFGQEFGSEDNIDGEMATKFLTEGNRDANSTQNSKIRGYEIH